MTKRVSGVLNKLPRDINPVNLEELRRIKQALIELESKADAVRCAGGWMLRHAALCGPCCAVLCCAVQCGCAAVQCSAVLWIMRCGDVSWVGW